MAKPAGPILERFSDCPDRRVTTGLTTPQRLEPHSVGRETQLCGWIVWTDAIDETSCGRPAAAAALAVPFGATTRPLRRAG